ncbi:MAG TPA: NAD(P)H-hydrate dehydratase [Isosphaeraceae bacterium]|jgi:NAD(P)H-hydrate epimerase|nr:NAD(P)H-hydrate dehydratase [Isosphaeraceae bacterium]
MTPERPDSSQTPADDRPATPPRRVGAVPKLPKRDPEGHKGDYGFVLVIAGGRGMAGAASLVGASALRSGAGLVRVACPAGVQPTVAGFEPCYMTYPLDEDAQGLARFPANRPALEKLLDAATVLAIGPGLGQSDELRALVRWVVEEVTVPTVIDADALNALVGQTELLGSLSRPVVVTPHPGEFARLTGRPVAEIQADREQHAVTLAQHASHLTVVLKGARTVVTDGGRIFVNTTGNPGMATGGAGDALTGVIAALLGQGLSAFDAAALGAHAHGLAGDIAREHSGEVGLVAGDIVDSLPDAFDLLGAT